MLFCCIVASSSNAATKPEQQQLKRYYHADGYIKAIGHVAYRTIYSSNDHTRFIWKKTLRKLIDIRDDARTKLRVLRNPTPVYSSNYWIQRQIRVATIIGHSSIKDPWPNCPDPIWNGASSWQETVNCENRGNWYDSAGYYRCGLQFDPGWERQYGALCP